MKVDRNKFIEEYLNWLRFQMGELLPQEASPYRMMEIVRRQHHRDLKSLVTSVEEFRNAGLGTNKKA